MKTLIIFLLLAGTAQASSFYGNTGYERRIRIACEKATSTTPAAKKCFYEIVNSHRQQELIESQIRLNNAKAEWYERHKNNLNYRGFPE
jgi:hypothetical protein